MAEPRTNYPKPEWTVWNFSRFSLRGIPRNDARNSAASLTFKMHNGNPRFTMYLNEEGGSTSGTVVAIEPNDIFALFAFLRRCIKSKEAVNYTARIKALFVGGKRQEKPVETSRLSVGKDEQGYCYISIQPYKRETEFFRFKDHQFTTWVSSSGEPLDKHTTSAAYAEGWINRLEGMISSWFIVNMKEDPNAKKDRRPGSEYDRQYPVNKPSSTNSDGWGQTSGEFDDDVGGFD